MPSQAPLPVRWWLKFILVVITVVFGAVYTLSTFLSLSSSSLSHSVQNILPDSKVNLGLDLKGGLSLTLNVELEKAVGDSIYRSLNYAKTEMNKKEVVIGDVTVAPDHAVRVHVLKKSMVEPFRSKVVDQTNLVLFDKVEHGDEVLFEPNKKLVQEFKAQAMTQAIGTVRNRIDQFGVSEPSIFQSGDTRIIVELPGMTDIERAKKLLGNTAQLDFRMVLGAVPQTQLMSFIDVAKKNLNILPHDMSRATMDRVSNWLREKKKIPQDSTVLLYKTFERNDEETMPRVFPYLVESYPKLTGDLIDDARETQTTENYIPQFAVSLKFKPEGSTLFGDMTTNAVKPENAPHQIAIVLDGEVQSAPVVNSPILNGDALITMGHSPDQSKQLQSAQDLALVLRAGALPAAVHVLEERQIGPSEGSQNIRYGVISTVIAAALVVILMVVIYGAAGIVANIAMFLNVLLILAFMSLFQATLTLPGIAGIVLTLAIAVDGNVIINERIREELRSGHSQKAAFYKGYESSFKTLVDAHITSAVAGLVLLLYGNPTVKGFAVTLLYGILCTLFTSYFVTEVIGQWLIEKTQMRRFG